MPKKTRLETLPGVFHFLPISEIFKQLDKPLVAKWLLLSIAAVETIKRELLDKADLSPSKTWSHSDKGERMLRNC